MIVLCHKDDAFFFINANTSVIINWLRIGALFMAIECVTNSGERNMIDKITLSAKLGEKRDFTNLQDFVNLSS